MAKVNDEVLNKKNAEVQADTQKAVSQAKKAFEATEALAAGETGESAEEEQDIKIPTIYVVRRKYTNKADGRQYWEYILPAVFRGSVSEVRFKASDRNGYEALDKLFTDGMKKIELQFHEEKQYDERTGMRKYFVYEVVYKDEYGFEWRYPLKTSRASDKAVMENYIRLLRFEAEQAAKAAKK